MNNMSRTGRQHQAQYDDEGPWWRLDFTMVLILLLIAAILMVLGFEFWHSHPFAH